MSTILNKQNEYYLTRAQYEARKTAGTLVAGATYNITDETYMENPMTTTGDIVYGGTSGTPTRLAKGTDGQVLKLVSGSPAWSNESGGVTSITAGTGLTGGTITTSGTIAVDITVIQEKLNSGVNANVIAPLYVDTGELRISLGNGVHKTSDDALEPVLKTNGGLLMDANGIYVDTTEIQEKLTFDNSPVQNSTNPVTSGGIYTVQQNLVEQIAGKRAAYVITDSNKVYNGSTAYASGTDLGNKYFTKIDISSTSTPSYVTISDMQAGDIIYIINSGIPDVWLAGFDNNDTLGYLAPLETQSPTLTNYYTKTETDTLLTNKEATSNKVTSLSSSSTDTQYPSAKCVYDLIGDIETTLSTIIGSNS